MPVVGSVYIFTCTCNTQVVNMKKQTTEENPPAAEGKQLRNKATICATVSPWLKRKLEALVDEGELFRVRK